MYLSWCVRHVEKLFVVESCILELVNWGMKIQLVVYERILGN